jgi:hypothetical protein
MSATLEKTSKVKGAQQCFDDGGQGHTLGNLLPESGVDFRVDDWPNPGTTLSIQECI